MAPFTLGTIGAESVKGKPRVPILMPPVEEEELISEEAHQQEARA